jgi:hypothetical protein
MSRPALSGGATAMPEARGLWALPQLAQKLAEARIAAPHCSQNTVSLISSFPADRSDISWWDSSLDDRTRAGAES